MRPLPVLFVLALMWAGPASAEEWAAAAADTPKPAAKRVVKKPAVRKITAPAPTLPAAPVPYTSLKPSAPSTQAAGLPLKPIATSESVSAVAVAGAPVVPEPPPPPPPPAPPTVVVNLKAPPAVKPASGEILLKCDTTTSAGNGSSGSFYLSLIPSEAFPDSGADFKVISIDPGHHSIIRDTLCFSFRCNAAVSSSWYELVDQTQKRGGFFKVSLNRKTGAFSAQKRSSDARFGLGTAQAISETGTCRPQNTDGPVLF